MTNADSTVMIGYSQMSWSANQYEASWHTDSTATHRLATPASNSTLSATSNSGTPTPKRLGASAKTWVVKNR